MDSRIVVEEDELRRVFSSLQEEGFTIREISDNINTNFRNALYKGSSLSEESFRELQNLYGKDIEHERQNYIDGEGFKKKLKPGQGPKLAELIGLILGDGHLRKESKNSGERSISNHYIDICLGKKEKEIIRNTEGLLKHCLGKEVKKRELNDSEAVSLRVHGVEIVEGLESVGIEPGDKVENQVGVPNWIKEEDQFKKACLKGLIDSDGSIYNREDGYKVVYFKNHSKPLLKDFKALCKDLDIKVSSAGPRAVQIASQSDVEKFLTEIRPIKSV